jgi:hypothetical protein
MTIQVKSGGSGIGAFLLLALLGAAAAAALNARDIQRYFRLRNM